MRALFRIVGSNPGQVSVISDADKAASLLEENNRLIADIAQAQAELNKTKGKLKNKKKDLGREQRLKDGLIKEIAASGTKNRKEIKELKAIISLLETQQDSLNSEIASKIQELRAAAQALADASIEYNILEKKFRRIRLTCIALSIVILIVVAFNWYIVLAFCLKAFAFLIKTLAYLLSGWA